MARTNLSSYGPEKPEPTLRVAGKPSSTMSSDQQPEQKFSLDWRGQVVIFTLCVLTLMAALDGTSLSVALPVSRDAPCIYPIVYSIR